MKSRKQLNHVQLVTEVVEQLNKRLALIIELQCNRDKVSLKAQ